VELIQRFKNALTGFRAETPSDLAFPQPWFQEALLAAPTASGRHVTPETALRASAVLSCVRILCDDLSTLPLRMFVRTKNGSQYAVSHPVFELLYSSPNDEMTSVELREHMILDCLLTGNFYNLLRIDGAGDITAIEPLAAANVIPRRDPKSGNLLFDYAPPVGGFQTFTAEQIWRGQMLSHYGITGRSVALLAREAIGLALAAEEQGARLFSNGAQVTGFLSTPQGVELTKEQRDDIATSWKAAYGGSSNAMKTALLQQGLTYQKLSLTAQESQFIEARKFQLQEICRIFRIPAILLGANDKESTFASAEAFFDSYVRNTLLPWTVRIEQTITRDLLRPSERSRFYAKHNFASLLRADTAARYAAYSAGINAGWLSRNEVREMEELNTEPGLDTFMAPLNTGTVGPDGKIANPTAPPIPNTAGGIVKAAISRVVRKETKSGKYDAEFVTEVLCVEKAVAQDYCAKRASGAIPDSEAEAELLKLVGEKHE
jgi:HK97 family phage portal protein